MAELSAEDKKKIRKAVLRHLGMDDDGTVDQAEELQDVVEAPFTETTDRDQQYQAEVAGDMQLLLDESQERQQAENQAARELDFSPADVVRPGAIVSIDGHRYVVGVVVDEVTVDGQTYAGISTDAPLYEAIEGKQAGNSFELNGKTQTIDFVA